MRQALLAAALLAAAAPAAAQTPSPRYGSFELRFSGYHPNIDAEFGGRATPYADAFGGSRGLMFRFLVSRSLFTRFGTLDAGIGAGYWERYGRGHLTDGTTPAGSTAMKLLPLTVALTYRFVWLAERYGIPLAPYGRLAFERYQWWVDNGSGNTAVDAAGHSGSGSTSGYSFTLGAAFLLDFLDPSLAREMDRDTGINHTYVFVDLTKSYVSDFHSATSWDLSDDKWTIAGGLMFVF